MSTITTISSTLDVTRGIFRICNYNNYAFLCYKMTIISFFFFKSTYIVLWGWVQDKLSPFCISWWALIFFKKGCSSAPKNEGHMKEIFKIIIKCLLIRIVFDLIYWCLWYHIPTIFMYVCMYQNSIHSHDLHILVVMLSLMYISILIISADMDRF